MVWGGHAPPSAVPAVTITFTVLAAIVASGRLYTRVRIVRKPGLDDVCIVIAVVRTMPRLCCACSDLNAVAYHWCDRDNV